LPRARVNIVSHSEEAFEDRNQAGRLLAGRLAHLQGKNAIVLGIPRGGIIVARALASGIGADLDIVLSRKLGTPGQPELAMGALTEDGRVFINESVVRALAITEDEIEQEKSFQLAEIQRRKNLIRSILPKTSLDGRIVIVTDDGVATGATMQAALWAVQREKPERLVAAIPVASDTAIDRLTDDADDILCLRAPPSFYAVGQFYAGFSQVEDSEVIRILEEEALRRAESSAGQEL
jgi:putative phosphoribosyl transferase